MSNGVWGDWDDSHPCLNTDFVNGIGQTGFFLEKNNLGTFDIRISISGYASRTERIW